MGLASGFTFYVGLASGITFYVGLASAFTFDVGLDSGLTFDVGLASPLYFTFLNSNVVPIQPFTLIFDVYYLLLQLLQLCLVRAGVGFFFKLVT